jgi:hypothetical protein
MPLPLKEVFGVLLYAIAPTVAPPWPTGCSRGRCFSRHGSYGCPSYPVPGTFSLNRNDKVRVPCAFRPTFGYPSHRSLVGCHCNHGHFWRVLCPTSPPLPGHPLTPVPPLVLWTPQPPWTVWMAHMPLWHHGLSLWSLGLLPQPHLPCCEPQAPCVSGTSDLVSDDETLPGSGEYPFASSTFRVRMFPPDLLPLLQSPFLQTTTMIVAKHA